MYLGPGLVVVSRDFPILIPFSSQILFLLWFIYALRRTTKDDAEVGGNPVWTKPGQTSPKTRAAQRRVCADICDRRRHANEESGNTTARLGPQRPCQRLDRMASKVFFFFFSRNGATSSP